MLIAPGYKYALSSLLHSPYRERRVVLALAFARLGDVLNHGLLLATADLRILFGGTAGMVQTASAVLYYDPRQCRLAE